MIINNKMEHFHINDLNAKKNYVYLVVTNTKELYVIKQTGARSWSALNMDSRALTYDIEEIHGNSINIMGKVDEVLNISYVVKIAAIDKALYRKCVMEFSIAGTIGETTFNAEIVKGVSR